VTCIVHRAMGEPLTLWHYGSTFDFTGSPVFLYKNHNGAYLAASMAVVLGLAASARGWIGRLLWETSALWVWGATIVVNSRVATGCATAWGMIYVARSILMRADAKARGRVWAHVLVAGACAVALAIALESGGGVKALKRFAPLASTPADFLQGGHFRVMLREVGYYMWHDSPVWGWGGGSYLYLYNTYHVHVPALAEQVYREQPQLNRFFGPTANCDWIEFAVEYGAVGVGLMAAMALIPFVAWWRARGWSDGLALFLVIGGAGLVAHAYFDYILRNPALLMLGAGSVFAALRLSRAQGDLEDSSTTKNDVTSSTLNPG
jgi:O-antigen ligase